MKPTLRKYRIPGAPAVAVAVALLAACSPEFNWREVHAPDGDYRVMLPGKPASMTRDIRLEDLSVPMTMQGARVDESSFTVAVAKLPDGEAGTREIALAAMRAGMLRNISATSEKVTQTTVTLVDASGVMRGRAPALRVDAQGSVNGKPAQMTAGFVSLGTRAYQWVVIGSVTPAEQVSTFIESFRLVPMPMLDGDSSGASSQAVRPTLPAGEAASAKGSSK